MIILFFACKGTKEVWQHVLSWIHVNHSPLNWELELQWIIGQSRGKSKKSMVVKLCAAKTIYHLWVIRNSRVFKGGNDNEPSLLDLKDVINGRIMLNRKLRELGCNL